MLGVNTMVKESQELFSKNLHGIDDCNAYDLMLLIGFGSILLTVQHRIIIHVLIFSFKVQ